MQAPQWHRKIKANSVPAILLLVKTPIVFVLNKSLNTASADIVVNDAKYVAQPETILKSSTTAERLLLV